MIEGKGHITQIVKERGIHLFALFAISIFSIQSQAQLTVNEAESTANMISLIEGSGLTISNFTVTAGANRQYGSFTNTPDGVLGLDQGIILSTGRLTQCIGPNNTEGSSVGNPDYTDPDITAISPLATRDAVVIEFDVLPKCDTLQIDFQFASEEYNEYVCSNFNDAFAFFVSGPGIAGPYTNGAENFAILPDGTPVSIGNVNNGTVGASGSPGNCGSLANSAFFIDNAGGTNLQHDGFTVPLQAKGAVIPCQTYHVKMVIADAGDSSWDSAVFLKSFSCPGQLVTISPDPVFPNSVEGCQNAIFLLERGGDTTVPLDVDLTYAGTATQGTDYQLLDVFFNPVPATITFAADETVKLFFLTSTSDGIAEVMETVDITATWWVCTDQYQSVQSFEIHDATISLTCPANIVVNNDPGTCGAPVSFAFPAVTSNCSGPNLSRTDGTGLNSGNTFPIGTTTISYQGEVAGNVYDNCSFTITVNDTENPTITCPGNQTQTANASCQAIINDYTALATTSDNCPGETVTQSPAAGSTISGTQTVTLTVTDASGNTNTCTFDVTLVDTTNPTITCPADANEAVNASCDFTIPDYTGSVVAADNCDATLTLTQSPVAGTVISGEGTIQTITITATDDDGNANNCSFDITLIDTIDPTITCPANQTVSGDASCQASLADYTAMAVAADNCDASVAVTQSPIAGTTFSGTQTVTLTATDNAGNTNTCTFDVTVVDTTNPTITCPANANEAVDASCDFTIPDYTGSAVAADNCDATLTLTQSPVAGTVISGEGTVQTITLTATDDAGNADNCSFDITLIDTIDPTITCPADQTVSGDASCQASLADYTAMAVAADNCDASVAVTQSPIAGTTFSGTQTVTLTATDNAGNTNTCTFDVTVVDTTNPTITCPANANEAVDASCDFTIPDYTGSAVAADNCDATLTLTQSPVAGTVISGEGTVQTITLTATDDAGNNASCTFDITLFDNIDPTITCPVNQNVLGDAFCQATLADYTGMAVTADNCDASVAVTQSPIAGTTITGTQTVTLTATDDTGNTATCTFDVIVIDGINPTIICPLDITQDTDAGVCTAAVTVAAPATADNCGVASVINDFNGTSDASDVYPQGTTTVTWTVTDGNGNTATCSMDITVNDNEAPAITCPADITQSNDAASCDAAVVVPAITATDNCGITSITNDYNGTADASGTYPLGTTTVNWTVTDIHGNVSTCTQDITINDDEDPTITCPGNFTVVGNATCRATVNNSYWSSAVYSDNCDPSLDITMSPVPGTQFTGTITITLTATDDAGNTGTCTFDVTVIDTTNPTITCPADITQDTDAGLCTASITVSAPGTADNCGIASLTNDFNGTADASDNYPVGTTTVNWTATDFNGNTATCSMDITVNDNEAPAITCPADIIQSNDAASCDAAVVVPAITATDNCWIASIVNDITGTADASATYPVGTTTVTWTVTDIHGNVSTCTQDITVNDDELPTITCPADQNVASDASCQFTVGDYSALITSGDNCDPTLTITQAPAAGTVVAGTTTVTFTATDDAGNAATCTFDLIVVDSTDPTITCPADITQDTDAGLCTATVAIAAPATADNCGVASVTNDFNGTADASDVYPQGTTTVTWTVTDGNGNTASCSMDITVNDNEAPAITCPADIIQSNDAASCDAAVVVPAITATDNCGIASIVNDITGTADASATYPVGTTTVTWTVTDIHGNVSTCTQDITVNDDELPTITCPADQNVASDASCQFTVGDYSALITSGDNCDPTLTITQAPVAGTVVAGTTTVTFTATDDAGNAATCTFDLIVVDSTDPTITCPADITQDTDAGLCTATVAIAAPATADNCGVASVTNDFNGTADASDVYPQGTTTVTWTVTDGNGNTASCSMDITVNDNEAPAITCPADIIQSNDATTCDAAVTVPAITATDNCGIATITNDITGTADASATYPVGTTTVTWTVTDIHGNVSTCTQDITVNDDELPTITCPADQNVASDASCQFTVGDYSALITSGDNCDPTLTITQAPVAGTVVAGTTTVTFTATDDAGNAATCTFDLIVIDSTDPTITCPADITQDTDAGLCTATVAVAAPATADNCGVASVTNDFNGTADASDVYPQGTTTVTWTVTDGNGNTASCSMDITVNDNEAPAITCPADIIQSNDAASCDAAVVVPAITATDNCGIASIVNDITGTADASATYPVGTTTVTWTVTDIHGNVSTCTQDITVNDDELPTITCPADQNVASDASCQFTVGDYSALITSGDNCDPTLTITQAPAAGTVVAGTTTVTFTATDDAGNAATCTFDLIVVDSTDPTITCPADITQDTDAGLCTAAVTVAAPATADNCGVASVTNDFNGTADASDVYPQGTTTVTWTVTDGNGNTASCSMDITVNDNEAPAITCPADIIQSNDATTCDAAVTVPAITATDNCGIATITNDITGTADASATYPVGTTTVTWTVTDIHGNVSTCTQDITVNDDELPTITCPTDQNVASDASCQFTVGDYSALITSGDNCDPTLTITQAPVAGTVVAGTTTVTFTATDDAGNAATCTFDLIVVDSTNPTITCPADITQDTDAGVCTAAVTVAAPATADNCGVASVTNDFNGTADASDVYPQGTTTVTWTVTDGNGNTASCSMDITVNDNEAPAITCPADIIQSNDATTCDAAVTVPAITATDNCGIATITNDITGTADASATYPVGTTTVTWTVTDIHGNVSTCTQDITVNDDELPTITCPADQNVASDASCQFTVGDYSALITSGDNCDPTLTITQAPAAGTVVAGTTTVTFTATDDAGNAATCTFDLIVVDSTNPTITCPADITQDTDAGLCTAAVTVAAPATADNCGVASVTNDFNGTADASDVYPQGTTTVTWTVTDGNGNTASCSMDITVNDNEAPAITCPADIIQSNDATTCDAAVTVPAITATDNCGIATITNDITGTADASATYPVGTTTVTWTVTDIHGNVSTCTQDITVNDDELPTITCPADQNVASDASCQFTVGDYSALITSGDNCDPTLTITQAPVAGTVVAGTTTVTFTATDDAGNAATCTFDLIVVDSTDPTITCPADITQDTDAGLCTAAVTVAAPATADNCGVASVTNDFNGTADASDVYPQGTTTVTWTVTDGNGNTASCSMDITVNDNEAPAITCPADIIQSNDAASCDAAVVVPAITATDNCGIASIVNDITGTADASATYPVGTTTVTWTVTDIHGNVSTCTQDITVNDDELPTITCPADQNVASDASCQFTVGDYSALITSGDNCDPTLTITQAPVAGTVVAGTTTVTFTATDDAGNAATCTFDLIVVDSTNPTITCPADITQDTDAGVCTAAVTVAAPATADNCGVASVTNDFNGTADASDVYPQGTTTVTWTVTDGNGNTASCSMDITVNDNEAPAITCPADIIQSNDATTCDAAVTVPAITATDNCGIATITNDITGTADASATYPVGTTTVTWTVTDIHGNVSTCTQDITVNDDELPTITCPADQNVASDASCQFTVGDYSALITSGDNCDPTLTITQAPAAGTVVAGTTTVTFTATDDAGNAATCTFDLIVVDSTAPSIVTCAPDVTETLDANCEIALPDYTGLGVATDNCDPAVTFTQVPTPGTVFSGNGTTINVTLTASDDNGNTTDCNFVVTLSDDIDPTITCPVDIIQTADAGACNAAVAVPAPVADDNCVVVSVINDYNGTADASDVYPQGTTTVTWTVTDGNGNTATCSMDITVNDNEAPAITCPADISQTADAGNCDAAVTVPAITATDNCGIASIVNDFTGTADASATYPVGTTTVTWTVTDIHGNVSTCTQDITVTDDELPTITCPVDVNQTADAGNCDAVVTVNAPAVNDNCGVATFINDYNGTADASDTYIVGTTVVTWTITDNNGNVTTCTQNITITDDEAPAITCPADLTQSNDLGACDAAVTVPAIAATDNCGIATIVNDITGTADASATYPVGTTTVTWTVTDIHGNVSTCTQDITVNDDELPTITCPADQNVASDASCQFTVGDYSALITSGDNCDPTLTITQAPAAGTVVAGTTTVTFTATDDAGNAATCTFDLIVIDSTDPTITCPADITQDTDAGLCTATVAIAAPATADNCGVASVTNDFNGTADASDVYPQGTTTVTWTVTDGNGNTASCSMDITVNDNEAPAITCPADIIQSNDATTCDAAVTVPAITATDNCGIATITNDITGTADASATYPVGTTTVTWTVTDIHGNVSTCTQDITVNDDELPTITCPADQNVASDASCQFTVGDYSALITSGDNCDPTLTITQAPVAGTVVAGTTTVTFTATDDAGNAATCTFDLIVVDSTDPTITCPADITQDTDAGLCTATVAIAAPATADNCGVASVTNDFNGTADASDVYPQGTTTVTWTVTDGNGNTASCSMDITVNDNEAPAITCPADIIQSNDATTCDAAVTVPAITATDNCGIATITNDITGTADASATYPVGTTTVTWTVTDIHGNVSTCTQDITVNDDELPTITCPADQTQAGNASCEALLGDYTALVVTADNCDVSPTISQAPVAGTTIVGSQIVTITSTDADGNFITCTFNVDVIDSTDPTITCPADITQDTDAGLCTATVAIAAPATADNCGVASVTNDFNGTADASDVYPQGTTTVTWTVTDGNGNTASCSMDITVNDNEAPAITCPADIIQSNDAASCDAAVTVPAITATDNCGIATITNDITGTADASATYPVGTTTVTWTVTDIHGNVSTCTQDITVNDDELPTITCPADQNVASDASCQFTVGDYSALITSGDNCDPTLTITQAPAAGTVVAGTTTVTFTATDDAGNAATCTFDLIVVDSTAPSIVTCAPDVTETLDANCEIALPDYTGLGVATDNCDPAVTFTQVPAPGTVFSGNGTTINVTLTASDDNGNTTDCNFVVTLSDDIDPTITCPVDIIQTADAGACNAAVAVPAPVADDNCVVVSVINDYNGTADASDVYPVGTTTINWTVTDINGNTATCAFDITVNDNELPAITCPADISQTADAGNCDAAVTVPAITATDNCGIASIVNDFTGTADASATYPVGTTTVTWTVTDIHGNVSTCTQDITVTDDELPTITCPVDVNQTADAGNCDAVVTVNAPAVNDNCGVATIINDYNGTADASDTYIVGTTVVTWTITDNNGNVTTCTQNITITDDEAPAITCPADLTQSNDLGACDAAVTVPAIAATDNCGIATIVNDITGTADASATYPVGTTTVTWTVTDIHGNVSTCTQDITVNDDELPTITCPADQNVSADASCQFTVGDYTALFVSNDNCDPSLTITQAPVAGTVVAGTTTVTFTATDDAGNTATCTFDLIVVDTSAPSIVTCAPNVTETLDANCEIALPDYTGLGVATDNCDPAVTFTQVPAPGTVFSGNGTTINVTLTASDDNGNTTDCNFVVTLSDDIDPTITCPVDIIQTADAGACNAAVAVPAPVADDNCVVVSVINDYNGTADASDVYPVGTTTINWTVTDINGNTATCAFDITVNDNELPAITCPADISQTADAGNCDAAVTVPAITATDNCGIASIVNDFTGTADASATYPVGTTTVTWTVTDIHGNVSTCTQDITVTDDELPTITCPVDVNQTADAGNCDAVVTVNAPAVNDNCGVATIINDYNGTADASDTYIVGTTVVTWTITDNNGNVTTCTQNITITDDEAPAITCPADLTQSNDLGACDAAVTVPAIAATDNCGIATIVNDITGTADASATYPVGTTTVTWTVTDIHGNVSTCTQDITVNDDELPTITCPADITTSADPGGCFAVLTINAPAVNDNCGVASFTNDFNGTADASDTYFGTTTVVWTVVDIYGNITTCDQIITIVDMESPVVTCPADFTELVDDACEFIIPDYTGMVTTSDNCDLDVEVVQVPAPGTVISGSGTVQNIEMTGTDDNGNFSICDFNITLDDTTAPEITCPSDLTEYVNTDCEFTVPNYTGLGLGSDNCSAPVITQVPVEGTVLSLGTFTITLTATDPDGNNTACNFDITVLDSIAPVITCPGDQIEEYNGDCEHIIGDYTALVTANDNCSAVSIVQTPMPGSTITGDTLVLMTVSDAYGNVSTCDFMVILDDVTAPVITCPADITVTNDLGECGAIVTFMPPVTEENCTIDSLVLTEGLESGSFFPVGTTTQTYVVTDWFGNADTCSFTITVNDEENPIVVCPADIEVNNDPTICGAVVEYDIPVPTDNCAVASIDLIEGQQSGEVFPVGVTTVTYAVNDIHGNFSSCSFNITVIDNEAPVVMVCPEEAIIPNDLDDCGAVFTYDTPFAEDNCGVLITELISGLESGSIFPLGTTTVVWSFEDEAGNTTLCTFDVTVEDTQAPYIACPADIVVNNETGLCGAFVSFDLPQVVDNCELLDPVMTTGIPSGELFPVGVTIVTYEVSDPSGNVSTCMFTVTVIDNEAPVVFCQGDMVQVDPLVEYVTPYFTDNCYSDLILVEGYASGTEFPHGYTEVVYAAVDLAGNADTCSFTVLINTPPTGVDDTADHYEEEDEIVIDPIGNDIDLDGDDLTLSDAIAGNGTVEIVNNAIIYAPIGDWCGRDTITYVLCDPFMACDTAIIVVDVECFIDLIIPEGFSPNNDGTNDTFQILGLEDYPGNRLSVYNRWGHLVYEAFEYQSDWEGKSEGSMTLGSGLLPEGTYFFVLELGDVPIKPVKGYVYLNR